MSAGRLKGRVCLLTSSHPVRYSRFFDRQAKSLALAGCEVTVIGIGESASAIESNGIRLVSVTQRRLAAKPSMLRHIARLAERERADVYQCLDPWTLDIGLKLKSRRPGTRVVYDASEWFSMSFRQRRDLPMLARRFGAAAIERLEKRAAADADAVLETNATRAQRFVEWGCQPVMVPNYPRIEDLGEPVAERQPWLAYTGLISRHRGFDVLLSALSIVSRRVAGVRLRVVGGFDPRDDLKAQVDSSVVGLGIGERIDWLGWLPYGEMFDAIRPCLAGVILLQPERTNDYTGLPNKLFEFMGLGLAVVASDFPEMARVVRAATCGRLVDPRKPDAVAEAVLTVLEDRAQALRLGLDGRRAVLEHYNWSRAEAVLLDVYSRLLG